MSPKQPLPGLPRMGLHYSTSFMCKFVSNSTRSTKGLVNSRPGRGFFIPPPTEVGEHLRTPPPPTPSDERHHFVHLLRALASSQNIATYSVRETNPGSCLPCTEENKPSRTRRRGQGAREGSGNGVTDGRVGVEICFSSQRHFDLEINQLAPAWCITNAWAGRPKQQL